MQYPGPQPDPRIVATITALPWLVIWVAALIILLQGSSPEIPFEHTLTWLLVIGSPLMAWIQFKH